MFRVGLNTYFRNIDSDLMDQQIAQTELNHQISTGNKVNKPSDAAGTSVTILGTQQSLLQLDQYRLNLDFAQNWLEASETSINSILDALNQAVVLAEQMSTGTYDELEHQAAASEIDNIIAQIITLANTKVEGSYLFAGSGTDSAAITSGITAADPASLTTASTLGHGTDSSVYEAGAGDYRFRLTRDTTGASATITIAAGNTLGASLGIIDFNSWGQSSVAGDGTADIYTTDSGAASATTAISNQIGEEFSWTGDSDVGQQTYRTAALLTVTGANTVQIGADIYANTNAADLVDQINSAAGLDYFAWLEGTTEVHVVHRGTGAAVSISEIGASGNLTIDAETNLTELSASLDSGIAAAGVIHIDGASGSFPPAATDTVTLGGNTWTWSEIIGTSTPATAGDYANLLSAHIAANTDQFSATVSTSGTGATVQIQANAVGAAGNVALASSNAAVTSSSALYGGLDGTDTETQGRLYGTGTASNLRLGTVIQGTVLDVDGSDVTLRLRWYDDDGTLQSEDVVLSGEGSDNAVAVAGTGGLSIYRDSATYTEGAVFSLEVGHYQGNQDELNVNFSESTRMSYNWSATDIIGDISSQNLLGSTASAKDNTGTGSVQMAGVYRGVYDREFVFDVSDGGQVPGDDVTLTVRWTGDDGVSHAEDVTISGSGLANQVEIPGADGAYIYLDNGTFTAGDSFHYKVEQEPVNVLDTLNELSYQLTNGTSEEGQTASQVALQKLNEQISHLTNTLAEAGTKQGRIEVRSQVMNNQDDYNNSIIVDMQNVDISEAYLNLANLESAYQVSLKTFSIISELSLVNLL